MTTTNTNLLSPEAQAEIERFTEIARLEALIARADAFNADTMRLVAYMSAMVVEKTEEIKYSKEFDRNLGKFQMDRKSVVCRWCSKQLERAGEAHDCDGDETV